MNPVALGRWHLARPRLSDRGTARRTVVEAGAGFGKTSLARETARSGGLVLVEVTFTAADDSPLRAARRLAAALRSTSLDTATRLADLEADDAAALAAAVVRAVSEATGAGVLVLLDDVHHLDDEASETLAAALASLDPRHRVMVCGRRVPHALRPNDADVHIGPTDLALSADETAEVLRLGWELTIDGPTRLALEAACGGWPGAVVLAAPRLAAVDALDAPAAAARAGAIANLLADLLAHLDDAALHAVAQLARLPLLGPALDRPLGIEGLFDASRAAGLPYHPDPHTSWYDLPDVIREQLVAYAPADVRVLARAAAEYVRRDLTEAAVTVLLDAGEVAAGADLLADLPPGRVEALDIADLQTLVDRLPDAELQRRPEILVHLARACIPTVAMRRRVEALERALAATHDDSPLRRAVDAERALDLVRDGHADDAAAIADRLLRDCGPDEVLTRARAFDALGRAVAFRGETEANLREAGEHLRTAAVLADRAGVPGIGAEVLLALGYAVEFPLGRLGPALDAIDAALARVAARPRRRATIQTFRADVLHSLGRDADASAALAEAAELARRLADDRLIAYAAWEAAKGASRRGEHDPTLEWVEEVHRHRGPWFEHPTGMVFLADAAECCERIGEQEQAAAFLDRAEAKMRELLGTDDLAVWLARAACASRSGDPAEAIAALDVVDRLPGLPPKDRWRPLLLRAQAHVRRGERTEGAVLARAAFDVAAANGTARLPDVLEPGITANLRALVATNADDPAPALRVQVLGGFALHRDGVRLEVPAGLPAQLVKLLALANGRLHQDVVIDRLWPDGDLGGAGQRLRNVLHRLRGADVVRRDGDSLALTTPVRIDLAEFDTLAARAAAGGAAAAIVARQGAAQYTGPLLPDDLYVDWTIAARERARRSYLDLLELLAADAEARGDIDEAIDHLRRAWTADPDAEAVAVRLATLHARAGRVPEALRVLGEASVSLAELGVEPSAEHRRLLDRLRSV